MVLFFINAQNGEMIYIENGVSCAIPSSFAILLSEYWKGIECFGNSRAVVMNNAVFDKLGWGFIATGSSYMKVVNNLIYNNGNCGFAVWDSNAAGIFENNIVTENGWREEWSCPYFGILMKDQTSINGNISPDPFFSIEWFILKLNSPCINSGNTLIINLDGSRSDMGIWVGPMARKTE